MATDNQGRQEAHISESSLMELEDLMEKAAARGMREGIRAAIQDDELVEAFWNKGMQVAKQQAKLGAGSLLFDSFSGFFKGIWKIVAVGMIIYYVGGWDLLAHSIKVFLIGGPK